MCSYFLWVLHEHEELLLMGFSWAWAVIAYDLHMSLCSYYFLLTHEHEDLLLKSLAWACEL